MNPNEYFTQTKAFANYDEAGTKSFVAKTYVTVALGGEFGEFLNKLKKLLRQDGSVNVDSLLSEMGDVFWYLSQMKHEYGTRLPYGLPDTPLKFESYDNQHIMHEIQKFVYEYGKVLKVLNRAKEINNVYHMVNIDTQWTSLFKSAAAICNYLGASYERVLGENIKKLEDRASRGVIYGTGDDR